MSKYKIIITRSKFDDTMLRGIVIISKKKIYFKGYWEEGYFSIDSFKPKTKIIKKIMEKNIENIEEQITDEEKQTYTDGTW